jgi:parallel beta-helix repeat protein
MVLVLPVWAKTYYVDGVSTKASDKNPGTAALPWKTIARAGSASELKPGDTVLISSGVYRETASVKVSGEPGKPITFAAAPNAKVVIKGSEIIKGPWTRCGDEKGFLEPFKFAARRLWKIKLGDEFFTDARFPGCYDDKARRWVSQVFIDDDHPLQMIGQDGIYKPDQFDMMVNIGKGVGDMIPQSFFYDVKEQTLYLDIGGDPGWFCIEVGVRGFALTCEKAHDVVIRGLEMRHNRQPGGQWPLVSINSCERVDMEDCRVYWADFCGMSLGNSKNCVLRRCDFSNNGAIGLALGLTEDCTVEDCTMLFNNYRHFYGDWGVAAGTKNIPDNKRTTIQRCEVAYNTEAEGIWFDTGNSDLRLFDNICHDNGDCGIMTEANPSGIIAGNLVYGNHGRGIYISGTHDTWAVHNTVVENASGIVAMTRAAGELPRNVRVLNNLFVRNYVYGDTVTRGSDLTLEAPIDPATRAEWRSIADYNVYANNSWVPSMRHNWNDNNTLEQWQQKFGHDLHSRQRPIEYERVGTSFRLLTKTGLDVAGPLPEAVTRLWKPKNPRRVGCDRTAWMCDAK